ncbi:MAG: cytochrome P450 [Chloroflexi bacterium]|nr:cytochrome P450 [Chloroflexota bacterium]
MPLTAASEAMRPWSIAPALTRTTTQDVTLLDTPSCQHRRHHLPLPCPHHLETLFPNPEVFDIERMTAERKEHRQPGVHAPFGLGPHTCLGQGLAEMQMALSSPLPVSLCRVKVQPGQL